MCKNCCDAMCPLAKVPWSLPSFTFTRKVLPCAYSVMEADFTQFWPCAEQRQWLQSSTLQSFISPLSDLICRNNHWKTKLFCRKANSRCKRTQVDGVMMRLMLLTIIQTSSSVRLQLTSTNKGIFKNSGVNAHDGVNALERRYTNTITKTRFADSNSQLA